MRTTNTLVALGWAAWIVLATPLAWAGGDHGEAPASSAGPTSPLFAATSETFELVGVVNGKQLTLYLDRYADGSPVKDAKLELELGGVKVPVEPHAEGEFEATLAQDMYLAGAFVLMLSTLTLIGTLISDILLAWLDPRIRYD